MSGTFANVRLRRLVAIGAFGSILICASHEAHNGETLPKVTRDHMLEVPKMMAEHKWLCKPENRKAPCSTKYRSRFKENEVVTGVAYDWGGMDDETEFTKKLAAAQAAGSHKEEGVSSCTAGVDCSGLVSRSWGQTKKFGTASLPSLADGKKLDRLKDLRRGDVLNKSREHVVLFVSYNPDGTVNVYEASGKRNRVVFDSKDWPELQGYVPLRYKGVIE